MEPSIDEQQAVALLAECVRIKTANPPGDEAPLADFLARYLMAADVAAEVQPVAPGRANLLARLPGSGERPALVLSAHLDTVPPGETPWQHDPWSGHVTDGRLYGLGAADMKSGLAAMVMALVHLRRLGARLRGDLVLAATAGEEIGFDGVRAIIASRVLAGAGGVVIGEPTDMEVAVAHKGQVRLILTTKGRTAHSSTPERGVNAILRMHDVLGRLRTLDLGSASHLQLGAPTLSVTTIHGGTVRNVVPDRCQIAVDFRIVPGLDADRVLESTRRALGDLEFPVDIAVDVSSLAVETNTADPMVRAALTAAERVFGHPRRTIGLPYATEACAYQPALRVPVIICGPGTVELAHQPDEWVALSRYVEAIQFYAEVAAICLA